MQFDKPLFKKQKLNTLKENPKFLGCVIQQFSMQHIILSEQQLFIPEEGVKGQFKYTEIKECNFIIKATSRYELLEKDLVQSTENNNQYILVDFLHKDYTFYLEAKNIKNAINIVNKYFTNNDSNHIKEFESLVTNLAWFKLPKDLKLATFGFDIKQVVNNKDYV